MKKRKRCKCGCGKYVGRTAGVCRISEVREQMRGEWLRLAMRVDTCDRRGMEGEGI